MCREKTVIRTSAKRLAYKSLWENSCLSPYCYIVICGVWLQTHTITTTANIFLLCSKEGEKKPLKCICVHHCLQMKDGLGAKKSSNKEKKRLRHKKSHLYAKKTFLPIVRTQSSAFFPDQLTRFPTNIIFLNLYFVSSPVLLPVRRP